MGAPTPARIVNAPLLLDEHYAESIAHTHRAQGWNVLAVVSVPDLVGVSDEVVYSWAVAEHRRVVTENIKDFRPLLTQALSRGEKVAPLLLVPPRRFPRGRGDRNSAIAAAISAWLTTGEERSLEEWLI